MNIQTLKALAIINHLNQSDLARAAGVSRQCASQWLHGHHANGFVNIQTKHLLAIADALNVKADDLLRAMPLLGDDASSARETTRLLWDKLYPDLTTLLVAALEESPEALARIVQVHGMYLSAKLFGARIWRNFQKFKKFIHPVRRAELEGLWQYRESQMKT